MSVVRDPAEATAALAKLLRAHHEILLFTGAGVSVDSGIPDFRSPGGVWTRVDPAMLSRPAIEGVGVDRAPFWQAMLAIGRSIGEPAPNPIHHAVAALEKAGRVVAVATQNIDGLHQAAGAERVLELHGAQTTCRCTGCPARWPTREILARVQAGDTAPDCEHCGGVIRPDLVLFGDMLDPAVLGAAQQAASTCDLCVVLGSGLDVYPAAGLPRIAARSGAPVAIVTLGRPAWRGPFALHVDAKLGETWVPAVELLLAAG